MKQIAMTASALMLASVAQAAEPADTAGNPLIEIPAFHSATGIFDIDALEALGRVSSPTVSPDGKKILFGISYENLELNRSNNDLWVMNTDGSGLKRLTATEKSENGAVWIDGGRRIAFMSADKDGKAQLWVMNADGSARTQASEVEGGINGFLFSPDEKQIILIGNVKYARNAADIYPDLPKATGRVVDDLMYKHWDEWVTKIPHPFLGAFDGSKVGELKDILGDEPYEAPMKPFGGPESFAWTPDCKQIVYVCRKKKGMDYALSTNSDLFLYNIADGSARNLTEGNGGYDTMPAFSPDGSKLAWLSMEHDGYESDKNRLMILDMATGTKTDLTADWDYTIDEFAWNPDGERLWFVAPHLGTIPVFNIDIKSRKVTKLTDGEWDYTSLSPVDKNTVVTMRHSMLRPNEVLSVTTGRKGSDVKQLTDVNAPIFNQLKMPSVERHYVPTTDGKEMLVWAVLPPDFDSAKKYPAILYCQGGPQQAVSQFWSYRWNFALMASNGYIMIAPNRRG
ncbi:MAG: peptidase S9, partial [Muribaculaceae bacterium]|nr:peptidase S9 [Muribaculaceae bacterium]